MIEELHSNSTLNSNLTKMKGMEDNMNIRGYVTVIKNAGKSNEEIICMNKPNLLTNAGRDWMHAQVYTNTGAGTRGAGFIALTSNTAAPAAGATTHSSGTNSTTIQKTFTASAVHTAVVKAALFNQLAVGGTMAHINTFTAVTLQSSDTLQVTWTVTLG